MAADHPATCLTRTSAAMVLNIQDKQLRVSYGEQFQLSALSQCWEFIENANMFLRFLK